MSNYKLVLNLKKDVYFEIDWIKLSNYSKYNKYVLKDIDSFTSNFDDEEYLKEELIKGNLIDLNDFNKKLSIRYKSKGKYKNLGYGLAYKEANNFLNEDYIIKYLLDNSSDVVLLEKLCNHYRNSYIEGTNINYLRGYINAIRANKIVNNDDIKKVLKDFIIREIYSYDASIYTYKVDKNGNPLIKYKGLHDLGMFLYYDYHKRLLENKPREEKNIIIPKEKVKVYKKKKLIDGQINIFDYLKEK